MRAGKVQGSRQAGRLAAGALVWAVILATAATVSAAEPNEPNEPNKSDKPTWRALFNGKDLDGWVVKIAGQEPNEDAGKIFRVEDGLIKVSYDRYKEFKGEFGHLFYKEPFSYYRLRVEYRFLAEQLPGGPGWAWRNSGVMFHSQPPGDMGKDQPFPVSIEAQMLGGDKEGERPTGNLCTPGTNVVMEDKLVTDHCINSKSKTYRGDQWVTLEIEVHGNEKVLHKVNGKVVLEYDHPQLDERDELAQPLIKAMGKQLQAGYIALQAESHPVQFRKVEILVLEDSQESGVRSEE